MTKEKEHKVFKIVALEALEKNWFIELLSKRPSGHYRDIFVGESPYTGDHISLIHSNLYTLTYQLT